MSDVNPNGRIATTSLVACSGLDKPTLIRVARDLQLPMQFANRQTKRIEVDYIPAVIEQAVIREDDIDIMPARPVLVTPIPIVFELEDHMFGGITYVALVADGHIIGKPVEWRGYEHYGTLPIGVNA